MNKPPLANIFECSIFLPAIQYNRIANYKAKNFFIHSIEEATHVH